MNLTDEFQLPAQWHFLHQDDFVATFRNEAGDFLTLNYFPVVPDIAADIADANALRAFYRTMAESNQVAMLAVDPFLLVGLPAVLSILKARMEPRGFAFIGSYTLPFSDHSFVIKVQSMEHGITGIRETAVMMMQSAPLESDEVTGKLTGWEQDPYEPGYRGAFMCNKADDPKHDAIFPEHPLSKVRHYLHEIGTELEMTASIRAGQPFVYKAPQTGFWSKLWR